MMDGAAAPGGRPPESRYGHVAGARALELANNSPAAARIEPPLGHHRRTATGHHGTPERGAGHLHLVGIERRACGPLRALPLLHRRIYRDCGRRCRAGWPATGIETWARRRHACLGVGQQFAGRRSNRASTWPPPHRQALTLQTTSSRPSGQLRATNCRLEVLR